MKEERLPTLREVREKKGVSQTKLATFSTISQGRISLIEKEETEASFHEQLSLALALDEIYSHIAWPKIPKKPTRIPGLENNQDQTEGVA